MGSSSNLKRDQILQTGKDLFWKFGFKRVTVEEICREAEVSKMTFYKFFTNKMDLVLTIMKNFSNDSMDKYRSLMDSDIPFTEKVLGMIELKREQTTAMSNEFFRDYLDHADPEMMEFIERLSSETFRMFVEDLKKAQEKGDVRKSVKVEFILYFLNHISELFHDDRLLKMYDTPQELALEVINFFFYGIIERQKK